VKDEGIAIPILIGRPEVIQEKIAQLGLECDPQIINPVKFVRSEEYARTFYQLRQRKGVALKDAQKAVREPNVLGPLMVKMGDADAFVSGLTYDYPEVIRPALQIHHTHPKARRVAGVYIMIVDQRVLLFTDATVNIDPG
jgi:malate dehydrogenase (oxaloacetate-decarboxylating)(NADP+)